MTDNNTDICGHPTEGGDGPPCQHPATDGDSCWIDSHGGHADPGGRDWAIDADDHETILTAAREGLSKAGCARAAGVDEKSLARYLDADEHDEFRRAFMRARHAGERRLATGPLVDREGEPDMDGQHARFLLSTSFGYQKTEEREITGGEDLGKNAGLSAEDKAKLAELFDT